MSSANTNLKTPLDVEGGVFDVGKIVASSEASADLALAGNKQKYSANIKPKLLHADTAILLAKLKSLAEKDDYTKDEGMYVYGKNGIKITL